MAPSERPVRRMRSPSTLNRSRTNSTERSRRCRSASGPMSAHVCPHRGRGQEQEAAAARLPQPRPEEVPPVPHAPVQGHHERSRLAAVERLRHVQVELAARVRVVVGAAALDARSRVGAVRVEGGQVAPHGGLGEQPAEGGVERAQRVEQLLRPRQPPHPREHVPGALRARDRPRERAQRLERRLRAASELVADGDEAVRQRRLPQVAERLLKPVLQRAELRLQLPHRAPVEMAEGAAQPLDCLDRRRGARARAASRNALASPPAGSVMAGECSGWGKNARR